MIERSQWNVYAFRNPALVSGAAQTNVEISLDTDAPFRATGVAVYIFDDAGTPLGAAPNLGFTLRFTNGSGDFLQRHLISAQTLDPYDAQAVNGAGSQTAPYYSYFSALSQNIVYPESGSIVIDYAELAGVKDALVLIVFCGTKVYGDGAVWWPLRDPSKPARPYFGYSLQFDASTLPIYNVPLNIAPDADFAWQYGAQTSQPPAPSLSPVGAARAIGVKIKDWTGKYFMNDYVPLDLIFGFNNSQTPGLVYPEIYIPKNQVIYADFAGLP